MTDPEVLEAQYLGRKEPLRQAIDAVAQRDPAEMEERGTIVEVAEEAGVEDHQVRYVMDRWEHLVDWRRANIANPIDPEVVRHAYDDEFLGEMAAAAEPVADGMGEITVTLDVPLDKAFRMIKLLPGDLGIDIFGQLLEQSGELPTSDIVSALRRRGD